MELLLNALWLAIAAFTFAAWLQVSPSNRKQFLLGLVALFCLLLLLLPAVSITDDLHLQNVAVEDASLSKRVTKASVYADHLAPLFSTGIALVALWFAMSQKKGFFRDETSAPDRSSPLLSRLLLGRAPPAVAL